VANGRIINKKISLSKAVDNLSSDTCRLAFTWTIPHLDRDGRIHGDPVVLQSIVFPRRIDITSDVMESFIQEWAEAGLVQWYEAEGDMWLSFPGFARNQPNMRYDKEAESVIPPYKQETDLLRTKDGPTPDLVRSKDGVAPDPGRTKYARREEKRTRREEKIYAPPAPQNDDDRSVYHIIEQAFLSKNQDFAYGREGAHIVELEKKALARPDPLDFIKKVITVFWQLTHSNDKLFKDQPFLPSVLNSGGLWPRVMKKIEQMEEQHEELDPELEHFIDNLFLEQSP